MKNLRFLSIVLLAIGFSTAMISSCDSLGSNDAADLYGTWTIDGVTVDVTANGINIVDLMVNTFGFEQAEAEALLDTLTMDFEEGFDGTLEFKEDNTYTVILTGEDPENGSWNLSEDGVTLTLIDPEMDSENVTINKLNSTSLIITMDSETEDMDLDGDDLNETTMEIVIEIQLSRN